ncbi:MAG: hypothetical protein H0U76_22115 [Ktedonobacteraceae bacterium]|nr:hypothetical protein [Ktedonobacteraceae bacterium]
MTIVVITSQTGLSARGQALEIIATYADWRQITNLPSGMKRALLIRNYGEEEVVAMEEAGLFCASCYQSRWS